jgi:hypothetical protein
VDSSLSRFLPQVISNQPKLFQRRFEVVDDFLGDDVGYDLWQMADTIISQISLSHPYLLS